MSPRSSTVLTLMALAATAWVVPHAAARAQSAPAAEVRPIPQSQALEHDENLERLTLLAARPGKVGAVAKQAIALFKAHNARESEYILPPLVLLPYIADGKVTPDMAWALAMTDRVKADREQIFEEHAQVIAVLNELQAAGQEAHDQDAVEFARGAATDALNDVEILEPTVIMIGDVLHARLGAGH
jgi:hypothetical protein